jgi:hypothetical protein
VNPYLACDLAARLAAAFGSKGQNAGQAIVGVHGHCSWIRADVTGIVAESQRYRTSVFVGKHKEQNMIKESSR